MIETLKQQIALIAEEREKAVRLKVGDVSQWVPRSWIQHEETEHGIQAYLPPGYAVKKFGIEATLLIVEDTKDETAQSDLLDYSNCLIAEDEYVPVEYTHEDYRIRAELDAIAPDAALLIACAVSAAKTAELVIGKCDPEFIASLTATLFINETKKRHGERY